MIRRACALGSLLALVLQSSTGGHMLLVEHTRCAEHGELVHGGEAHHDAAGGDAHNGSAAAQGAADARGDEAHHHCSLWSDRRDGLASIDDADAWFQVAEARADFTLRSAVIVPRTPRFQIAPKTSPPA